MYGWWLDNHTILTIILYFIASIQFQLSTSFDGFILGLKTAASVLKKESFHAADRARITLLGGSGCLGKILNERLKIDRGKYSFQIKKT